MSTPNFYNQKNFKLYVQSFEPMSMEDFEAEYGSDSEIGYWEEMSVLEQMFYDDIIDNCDGFKTVMEDFNDTLTFHEVSFRSGYYSGIQLYVEENYYIPQEKKVLIEKKMYVIPNGIDEFWNENRSFFTGMKLK